MSRRTKTIRHIAYSIIMLLVSTICHADLVDETSTTTISVREIKQSERQEPRSFEGPSFDCKKASTKVEKTICNYRYLSDLDRELDEIYKQKRSIPEIRESVRESQLDWLRNDRTKCETAEGMSYDGSGPRIVSCISSAYRNRIQELNTFSAPFHSSIEILDSRSGSGAEPSVASGKPIKFKLMIGGEYPLCRDYVDMLNQAGYREAPVCERKILPDFPKFKAVEWAEITDKEEIKKIRKEQIIMEFLWPTEGQKKAKKFWLAEERKMDSGDYPILHRAHIDIDHDGEVETVYRFSVLKPELEKYGNCTTLKTYFIKHDDAKKNEEVYGRPLGVANTLNSRSGLSRLFYYDSRVRMDSWSQTYRYQLTVADIEPGPGSHACGVNIVQHGEADK